jgi:hypothetical protein
MKTLANRLNNDHSEPQHFFQQMHGDMDTHRRESRTVRPVSVVPETEYPILDTTSSPTCTILAGRYADIPIVVGIILIVATPFFGESLVWTSGAATLLAATLIITSILHTGNLRGMV